MFSNLSSLFATQPSPTSTPPQSGKPPSILDRLRRWTGSSTRQKYATNMTSKTIKKSKKKTTTIATRPIVENEPLHEATSTNGGKTRVPVDSDAVALRLRRHGAPTAVSNGPKKANDSAKTAPSNAKSQPRTRAGKNSASILVKIEVPETPEPEATTSAQIAARKNVTVRRRPPPRNSSKKPAKPSTVETEPNSSSENVAPVVESSPERQRSASFEDEAPSSPITSRLRNRQKPVLPSTDAVSLKVEPVVEAVSPKTSKKNRQNADEESVKVLSSSSEDEAPRSPMIRRLRHRPQKTGLTVIIPKKREAVIETSESPKSRPQKPGTSPLKRVIIETDSSSESEPTERAPSVSPERILLSSSEDEVEVPSSPITKRLRSRPQQASSSNGIEDVAPDKPEPIAEAVTPRSPKTRRQKAALTTELPPLRRKPIPKPSDADTDNDSVVILETSDIESPKRPTTSKRASRKSTSKKRILSLSSMDDTIVDIEIDVPSKSPKTTTPPPSDALEEAPSSPITHRTRSHVSEVTFVANVDVDVNNDETVQPEATLLITEPDLPQTPAKRQPTKRSKPTLPAAAPVTPPKSPKKSTSQKHPPTPQTSSIDALNQLSSSSVAVEVVSDVPDTNLLQKSPIRQQIPSTPPQAKTKAIFSPARHLRQRNNEHSPGKNGAYASSAGNSPTRRQQPAVSLFKTAYNGRRLNIARFAASSPIPCSSTDPVPDEFFDDVYDDDYYDEPVASTSAEWYQSMQNRPSRELVFDVAISSQRSSPRKKDAGILQSSNVSPRRRTSPQKAVTFNIPIAVDQPDEIMPSDNEPTNNAPPKPIVVIPFDKLCKPENIKLVPKFKKQFGSKVMAYRNAPKRIRRVFTRPYHWNMQLQPEPQLRRRDSKPEPCPLCFTDMRNLQVLKCSECEKKFHFECLGYRRHPERDDWCCADCIRCVTCEEYIDDPYNVQCDICNDAYHGHCKPEGSAPSVAPFDHWICMECATRVEVLVNTVPEAEEEPPDAVEREKVVPNAIKVPGSEDLVRIDRVDELINPKVVISSHWDPSIDEKACQWTNLCDLSMLLLHCRKANTKTANGSPKTPPNRPKAQRHNGKRAKKSSTPVDRLETTPTFPAIDPEFIESQQLAFSKELSPTPSITSALKAGTSIQEAYKKCYDKILSQLPFNKKITCYIWFNLDVIAPVLAKEYRPFGDYAPLMMICQKCYLPFDTIDKMQLHMNVCPCYHPPGKEVYRDEIPAPQGEKRVLSVFEVVGPQNMEYGENLCKLASFFITSKAAVDESYNFHYYVLTEFDKELGFVPVGYFSKALRPEFNDNLSCILVFPQYRGRGYGKFLIDVSYEMSVRDRRWGSPEEPLSGDGLLLYRSYWRGIVFEHFRKHRFDDGISLMELRNKTHIHMDDLTKTLIFENMVAFDKDDNPRYNCAKAWCSDLRMIRRLKFDPTLLWWEPHFDPTAPDHRDYYQCESSDDVCYESTTISTVSEDGDSDAEYYREHYSIYGGDDEMDVDAENEGNANGAEDANEDAGEAVVADEDEDDVDGYAGDAEDEEAEQSAQDDDAEADVEPDGEDEEVDDVHAEDEDIDCVADVAESEVVDESNTNAEDGTNQDSECPIDSGASILQGRTRPRRRR
uniref:Histone acetyltransferase n=1 Tax=Panagrellus redivivus TaxID=6233 RepID=A0A7E4VQJ3_PANRE